MNIQKYKAFIKTIELESFTKAAETLGYSQSGISRMISDLEKEWILEGRVDCGFLRLPTHAGLDCIPLEKDELKAIIPSNHSLAKEDIFPLKELCKEPFMLLEKGARAEISELFERNGLNPNVRFTTWDDYAVMSMVESGLGVSILPQLILKRVPHDIICKSLDVEAYRQIGFVVRDMKTVSIAVKRFMEYLEYRNK